MGSAKKAVSKVTGGAPKIKKPKPVAEVAKVTKENEPSAQMGYGGGAISSQGGRDQSNILDPIEATTDEEKEILG